MVVDLANIPINYFNDVNDISLLWLIIIEELLGLGYLGLLWAVEESLLDGGIYLRVKILPFDVSGHIIRIIHC